MLASESAGFPVGSRIFGSAEGARGGCCAEALIARASDCALLPEALDFASAAALVTASAPGSTTLQVLAGGPGHIGPDGNGGHVYWHELTITA